MRTRGAAIGLAFTAAVLCAVSGAAAARWNGGRAVMFDITYAQLQTRGPDTEHVGHRQFGRGFLRDATGRRVGSFWFMCTWTRVLSDGDALERCRGQAHTADGRLDVSGPSRMRSATQSWRVQGGTGAYARARGSVEVRDIDPAETLVVVTLKPRPGASPSVATVPRPGVDVPFRRRADAACTRAASRLAALPPFPLSDFDPLHPNPRLLPAVGAFFTGPGDPRRILSDLQGRLRALGEPPAQRQAWQRVLRARRGELAVMNAQDEAALRADVAAFVRSVGASSKAFRDLALAAGAFGVTRCIV